MINKILLVIYYKLSIIELLISSTILLGLESFKLNIDSITEISVLVVFNPQNADQSLTTNPAPITSLPLLTVPATIGT